ncbi:peptide-N(4)-(N-acetyl-beta-glucosaminyl)asparagine amidase-like [Paramacrobiotus metropolitanus]|uniref:peptide-N(4)-(N-acetyl-beta- glucosaminyl)asparagine amidase-like n=1 Tax=Paramacrobiotus metropolitanus TaxID=2943436 RepID=UPI002445E116|nr:peptide-N(4)-(N-acetyl-beta-glucosaminyl)asparagine amidase-like [Paramacrobiotus metropolitanus]
MDPNRPPAYNPAYNPTMNHSMPPPPYPGPPMPTAGYPPSQPIYPNLYTPTQPVPPVSVPRPYLPHSAQPFAHAGAGAVPPGYATGVPQPHVNVSPVFPAAHSHLPPGTFPPGYPGASVASGHGFPVTGHPSNPHYAQQQGGGNVGFVFKPSTEEVRHKKMEVQYCASGDYYVRSTTHDKKSSGWRSCVYDERNMFHKVEHDWKKAYIARVPNSDSARIEWRFDVSGTGYSVKTVKLKFPTKTYHNGCVKATFISDKGVKMEINPSNKHQREEQKIKHLQGVHSFSIVAELHGGSGSEAWQHAQLFRQDLKDTDCPFEVVVKLQNR